MLFAGIIIAIAILSATVYLALDKKSTLIIRLACLGAIALMLITLVICAIVVLTDNRIPVDPSVLIVGAPTEKKEVKNNSLAIFSIIGFVIVIFIFIAILTLREHKKNLPKTENADKAAGKSSSKW